MIVRDLEDKVPPSYVEEEDNCPANPKCWEMILRVNFSKFSRSQSCWEMLQDLEDNCPPNST